LLVGSSAYALGAGVSPVQKVVSMLNDMRAKGVQEKQDEQVRFAKYTQFCDDTSAEKKSLIEDANGMIEQLQADIQKAEADAASLARDIAGLDSDIAGWTQDQEEATKQRKDGNADFTVVHKDYAESIDALARALSTLKSQDYDRKQGSALLQKVSVLSRVPTQARRVIASFLATDSEVHDPMSVSAPQASSYEFQSGGVIDMLQDLHDKFEDELRTAEKEEMQAEHAFKLMMLSLENNIKASTEEREAKAAVKAEREEAAAAATGDLADTTAARDEDTEYLATLTSQCTQKSQDFALRQQLRAEELEAIQKAVEIVSSGDLQGNAEKHLDRERSFVLRGSTVAFAPMQHRLVAFLQARADKVGSRVLSLVAHKVQGNGSADGGFAKVRKMIDSMITRLLEEASEEEDHKGWCDTEMAKNKHTREAKTEDINALTAKSDKLSAAITRLAQEISDLQDAMAAIDKAVAEATEERVAEKAKNKETVEDARDAQTAVAQALAVLKDFYRKAAAGAESMKLGYDGRTRASLLQGPAEDSPETFDEPYTGMGDNAGGVVGLLEVIGSDFARVEAETEEAESEAYKAQSRFLAESSKDKAVKTTDVNHKIKSKTEKESDLNDTKKDLAGTQKELDAALVYHENLKPSCNTATVSYDDRVTKREEEIESLKEALQILDSTGR
jgi:hypothetical protein